MPTCFVIQPFDKGPFDRRFDDVLRPAIRGASLEPYRVDRDPGATIPIQDIENGIRNAELCLADITNDNPNVWFELGFAIASGKEVVLVCAASRQRFPFDIQHRSILVYETESSSDFEKLGDRITKRMTAILTKEERIGAVSKISSPVASVEGLKQHEIVALVAIGENIDTATSSVAAYTIRQDMEKAGFTKMATTLALVVLEQTGLASHQEVSDLDDRRWTEYSLTKKGMDWLLENQGTLTLRVPPAANYQASDEDVPF